MSETERLNRMGAELMGYLIDPSNSDIGDDTQFVYSPGKVTRDGIFSHYMYYRTFRHGGVKWEPATNLLQAWEVGSKVGALQCYNEPFVKRPDTTAVIVLEDDTEFEGYADGTTAESAALAIMRAVAMWHEEEAEAKRRLIAVLMDAIHQDGGEVIEEDANG